MNDTKKGNYEFKKKMFLLLMVIIISAVTILINVIASILDGKYNLNFDLTKDNLFQIGKESMDFIDLIDKKVEIYVLAKESDFTKSSVYLSQTNQILKHYENNNENISLRYVDYISDPTFSAGFSDLVLNHGDILLVSNEKKNVISTSELFNYTYNQSGNPVIQSSKAEEVIMSKVYNVISDAKRQISILTGHGEYSMPDLSNLLIDNNFTVLTQNLITEGIDEKSEIAFLIAPHNDLSADSIDKIESFLYNRGEYGKTFFYSADVEQGELRNLSEFILDWGVSVGEGAVFETDSSRVYNYHPFYTIADYIYEVYAGDLIIKKTPMLAPLSRPLTANFEYRNNNSTKVLLEFAASSAVRPNEAGTDFNQADAKIKGPISAMIKASYSPTSSVNSVKKTESNIIVSGSSGIFDSYALNNISFGNSEFLLNMINDLCKIEGAINIKPKTITGKELNISTGTANALGVLFSLIIPLLIILFGIGIWMYRRNK